MKRRILIVLTCFISLSTLVSAQDTSRVFLSMNLGKKFVYQDSTKAIIPGIPDNPELWNVFGNPLINDSLWKKEVDKNGLQVFTRPWPGSNFIAAKSVDTLHFPIKRVVAMMYDVDAYDQWIADNLAFFKILEWDKKAQYVITHFGMDMPWPVANRDVVVVSHYSQDPITKIVTLNARAIDGIVPEKKGYLRIPKSISRGTVIPLNENTTLVIAEGHGEPGGWLPAWLINFFIHDYSVQTSKEVKAQIAKEKYKTMAEHGSNQNRLLKHD
jgi:hypothetical protein